MTVPAVALDDDAADLEQWLGQRAVTRGLHLACVVAGASEQPPGGFPRHLQAGGRGGGLALIEGPSSCGPGQHPGSDAGDLDGDGGASWRGSLVLVREAPDERAQHQGQVAVLLVIACGWPRRLPDLLVVHPPLGELAGKVEPQRHLASPVNRTGVGEVDGAEVGIELFA